MYVHVLCRYVDICVWDMHVLVEIRRQPWMSFLKTLLVLF